jgi:hypothetical protein
MFVLQEKIAPPPPLFDNRIAKDAALKKLADEDEDRWVSQFIYHLRSGRIVGL